MEKTLNEVALCRPATVGIRQLSAEVSLGFRSPVIIRAGEVYGGEPGRSEGMLIINATFPDGSSQSFGKPEDLLRYMKEEGHMEVRVHAQYVFDTFANVFMTADEVEHWIDMKNGLQSGNFDRPETK